MWPREELELGREIVLVLPCSDKGAIVGANWIEMRNDAEEKEGADLGIYFNHVPSRGVVRNV
jgi:hypothetical protein